MYRVVVKKPLCILADKMIGDVLEELKEWIKTTHHLEGFAIGTLPFEHIFSFGYRLNILKVIDVTDRHEIFIFITYEDWREIAKKYKERIEKDY